MKRWRIKPQDRKEWTEAKALKPEKKQKNNNKL
jgi:hypothetical protein